MGTLKSIPRELAEVHARELGTRTLRYDGTRTDLADSMGSVFGVLVRLAAPVLAHFHSDLYIDALWLSVRGGQRSVTFYWSCDESGTTISDDEGWPRRRFAYRAVVQTTDGKSTLDISYLGDEKAL